jgi:hypothetical protein
MALVLSADSHGSLATEGKHEFGYKVAHCTSLLS